MKTQNISIRISPNIVIKLDELAKKQDRSRSYIIGQILKEKVYELAGDLS